MQKNSSQKKLFKPTKIRKKLLYTSNRSENLKKFEKMLIFAVFFDFFLFAFSSEDSNLHRICGEKGAGAHPLAKCSPYYVQCGTTGPLIGLCERTGDVFIPATPETRATCGLPEKSFECRKNWAKVQNHVDAAAVCAGNSKFSMGKIR